MQRKRAIGVVFLIILIIAIIGGIIIFMFTDLFRSDKQLFFKYLLDKNEMYSILEELTEKKNLNSYTSTAKVEPIYEYDKRIEDLLDDQIIQNLQSNIQSYENINNLNMNIDSKIDKENKNSYYNIQLKKNDNDIMKFELAKNKDKYAVKIPDVLNVYIGMENSNIKDLATKFNLKYAENFPEKLNLENTNYKDFIEISKEEKEHINLIYKDVLYNEIDKSNYKSEKDCIIKIENKEYYVNKYILTLNKSESIDIAIKMLESLQKDSITLNFISNKIKLIDSNSEYAQIEKINDEIQKDIEKLQKEERDNSEYIKISVYDYQGKTIRLDLYINEEKKLQLDYLNENGEKKLYINQLFTKNESGAISYDIKTSLLGANNINIVKSNNDVKIDVWLYNIKEIYKNSLDEMNAKYEEQKNNRQLNSQDVDSINQNDIYDLQKVYKQYETTDDKLLKLGFSMEIKNKSENNRQVIVYANICNSKIGANIIEELKYTDDVGEPEIMDRKNSLFLNNYSKEQIENLVKLIFNKTVNVIKQKIQ